MVAHRSSCFLLPASCFLFFPLRHRHRFAPPGWLRVAGRRGGAGTVSGVGRPGALDATPCAGPGTVCALPAHAVALRRRGRHLRIPGRRAAAGGGTPYRLPALRPAGQVVHAAAARQRGLAREPGLGCLRRRYGAGALRPPAASDRTMAAGLSGRAGLRLLLHLLVPGHRRRGLHAPQPARDGHLVASTRYTPTLSHSHTPTGMSLAGYILLDRPEPHQSPDDGAAPPCRGAGPALGSPPAAA